MKKTLFTLTASAVIASSSAPLAEAATSYTVKPGDSLWLIAEKHALTIDKLKSLNNLKSNIIYPNQTLTITKASSPGSSTDKAASAPSAAYTVKPGDSLSKIADQHNISLENLMSWNKLTTTLIFPGDVFQVAASSPVSSVPPEKVTAPVPSKQETPAEITTYIVKPGDYLGKIATNFHITIKEIKSLNKLSSDIIHPGQKLKIENSPISVETPKTDTASETLDYNVDILVKEGMKFLGLPYVWGGTTPAGFDCSGFIYYLYNKAGKKIPRYSSDGYFNRSYYVNKPAAGDIVFFTGTYRPGISHLGIYLGDNQFLHAESGGVKVSSLNNPYWKSHFDSIKRLY